MLSFGLFAVASYLVNKYENHIKSCISLFHLSDADMQ